jgi:serine/threonine protein phosphatase PrpC
MCFLFEYQINYHSDSNNLTKLPFAVFSLTQEGLEHKRASIGNQDAGCLYVGNKLIIGVVADGCTSGSNLNGMSHNQVGAYLGSYLAVRILRKLTTKNHSDIAELMPEFEAQLFRGYRKVLRTLNPWKFEYDQVLRNLLFSTLIIVLITENQYLIAHCGDGDIIVNGRAHDLQKDSGHYFASNLPYRRHLNEQSIISTNGTAQFKILEVGKTMDLECLFVATDGFLDSDIRDHPSFKYFFLATTNSVKRGFIDRKKNFRKEFLEPIIEMKGGRIWPADDATFLSIVRIGESR